MASKPARPSGSKKEHLTTNQVVPFDFNSRRSKHVRRSTGLYVRATTGLRLRDKKVERLARKMRQHMPWLKDSDMPAARAWAEMEYLCGIAYAALMTHGVLSKDKTTVRRLYHDYRQMRQTQVVLSGALGLTPAARSAIGAHNSNNALDIAQLASQIEANADGNEETVE